MEEKPKPTKTELQSILAMLGVTGVTGENICAFKAEEDGIEYAVWHIRAGESEYVLKRAKGFEVEVYRCFFGEKRPYAPEFFGDCEYGGEKYFISEYCPGETLSRCTREKLIKALDALIAMQDEFWQREEFFGCAVTLEKALKSIADRGTWLGSPKLERVYADFAEIYKRQPRTLGHEDLLPFNLLIDEKRAVLIDWEYGGMLPYPGSLARLIAHGREDESYLFFMTQADRDFAIDYYYDNLVKKHGISYDEYRRTLDYFIFYEYTEWIMLGNRYDAKDDERFGYYMKLAEELAERLMPSPRGEGGRRSLPDEV